MKDEEKRIKKLISDELDAEAKKTISEVEADMTLKDIALPGDMDGQLAAKIQEYEKQQANYRLLSEEDKEALRLGREMLAQRGDDGGEAENKEAENKEATKVVKFRKRRRMAVLLVATVGVMILGFGMTSIGGKPFIPEFFEQMLAGRKNTNIDSGNGNKVISDTMGEDEIYQEIKDEFGFDAVELRELPAGASFLDGRVDAIVQEASLLYNYEGSVIEYRVFANYRDKSSGYDIEDDFLEEYTIDVKDVPINIRQYEIEEIGKNQFIVYFEFKKINYILSGVFSKGDLEEMLYSLNFF